MRPRAGRPSRQPELPDPVVREQPGRHLRRGLGELLQRGLSLGRATRGGGGLDPARASPRDRARRPARSRPGVRRHPGLGGNVTTSELAERLRELAVETLEALERHHLPDWQIPRVYAGHAVGADVRADVCFTLAHLADAGVTLVAGEHPDTITAWLLRDVDGRATHTF